MQSETKKKWSAIIAEQQASQLTVDKFCAQKRVSPSTFYQRKRQLEGQNVSTFVKATVTESVEMHLVDKPFLLTIGNTKLSLPSSTPASYLIELIRGIHS